MAVYMKAIAPHTVAMTAYMKTIASYTAAMAVYTVAMAVFRQAIALYTFAKASYNKTVQFGFFGSKKRLVSRRTYTQEALVYTRKTIDVLFYLRFDYQATRFSTNKPRVGVKFIQ